MIKKNQSMKNLTSLTTERDERLDFRLNSLAHSRTRMSQPLLHTARPTTHVFGNTMVPIRGTYYRNSATNTGTWINESINVPLFTRDSTVFKIDRDEKIREEDCIKIKRKTLNRLSV
jgi:hypothetical protein